MTAVTDRLFVPLSTQPFIWFESGNKQWELRKYGRQYTEKTVYPGRRVELRCGYSNSDRVLWGTVSKVEIANSLEDFFNEVDFFSVIPIAQSRDEAIKIAKSILGIGQNGGVSFLGFKVRID